MQDFGKYLRSLARTPLGIIALLISLIYAIASLFFGLASSRFTESQTSVLIWFLVLFPILILSLFYRLLTAHHAKLYAPHEYKDEESFINLVRWTRSRFSRDQKLESVNTEKSQNIFGPLYDAGYGQALLLTSIHSRLIYAYGKQAAEYNGSIVSQLDTIVSNLKKTGFNDIAQELNGLAAIKEEYRLAGDFLSEDREKQIVERLLEIDTKVRAAVYAKMES